MNSAPEGQAPLTVSASGAPRPFTRRTCLQTALLLLLFVLALGIRLYDLKDPPLDFHPVRQLRSALIARSVYYQLTPAADPALRAIATDTAGLEIYEPPILEAVVGLTYKLIGSEQVWVSRIYTSICWLIGGLALLGVARRFFSFPAQAAGLAFYFFLPFSVIASRSFQPDPWMVMWVLLALYALNRWRETPTWRWAAAAGLLGGMAVLVKVFAAFFIGGIFTALLLSQALGSQGQLRRLWRSPQVWAMGALVVIPAAVYYLFILQDRSSGFFSFWTLRLGKLIFTSGFYADWLAMVSGLVGLALFAAALVGVCLAPGGLRALLVGFWVGYFLFGLFSPYQYTTHEYYHLGLVPMAALSCMPVVEALRERLLAQARLWRGLALGVLVFFAAYNLWVARSVLYAANFRPEATAWRKVGEALPENHSFIALTADYGMRLRYFGWRSPSAFWPSTADQNLSVLSGNQPLQYAAAFEKMTAGQDYFLVTAFSELDAQPELKQLLTTRYTLFKDGDGFVIYDLKSPITP